MIRICCDFRTGAGCMAENLASAERCTRCGRPLQFALAAYAAGTLVGPYLVVRRIGQGGYGAVYEAQDTRSPSPPVALKVSFDPEASQDLRREFALLRHIRHDHLPRYLDMLVIDGHGHLVMELIPGQSLQDVLAARDSLLPEAQVLAYALQICQVLADLHGHTPPIIHRDVKPANIRITPDGRIVLVDFGLVKRGGEQTVASARGVGTVQYAPFEQFGGGTTDERSDQFSLAATLYHLFTGHEPASVPERIAAEVDLLIPPERLRPTLSLHVARALLRGLAIRPGDRWPSVAHLGRALLGAPTEPLPPPLGTASNAPASTLPWTSSRPAPGTSSSGLPWPGTPKEQPAPSPKDGLPWPGQKRKGEA
ncbi:MAG: protein kinase [Oscillochloris sp.]|nr:protein kinase [Oscillochloris sp.]